jgi:ABC-2 type transport system permease protein
MTPVQAVIAKELRCYFVSPIVYVVGGVFLLAFGLLAESLVTAIGAYAIQMMQMQGGPAQINLNELVFRNLFSGTRLILLLVLPILSMRLFSEERKLRTFEFLLTSPIRIHELIAGKFISVCLIYFGLLGLTGIVPFVLMLFSDFDWYPVWTGYLALALLGSLFLATGIFASALSENQIVSALLSVGILFVFWLMGLLGSLLGDTLAGNILSYLSFMGHFDQLVRGLIDTKDLVYFMSGLALMLFLTHRVVESARWK